MTLTPMAELKTKQTTASVAEFIAAIADEDRRADCEAILSLMAAVTGEEPAMWGTSIVGFGSYRYKYASGREGVWPLTGFSPRKRNLTLYIMTGFDRYPELIANLGTYTTGKSCLYIKRLADVDIDTLRELVEASVRRMEKKYHNQVT